MKRFFVVILLAGGFVLTGTTQDAKAYYDEGVQLKNQQKSTAALRSFRSAVQLNPNYTEALYEIGWCSNDTKDYTGAIQALRQVVPVWPTIPKAHFELAYAFENTAALDSATYYYNKCLQLKPDYSAVFKQFGYIAYRKEDYLKAIENFDKYESYVKTPSSDYLYWYRKGFSFNALKIFSSAKTALQKSLEYKTTYANTYLELGFACSRTKEEDQAIEYYKKAMEIDPKSHIPYNGIGEVYRDYKKDLPTAITWYQKALDINPNERKANFGIGYCLNSTSKSGEAIAYLKRAIDADNTYVAAYVELGYAYYMVGNNSGALTNLNKGIELSPKNENARYYKGLVYVVQKDKTNAQRMVDELRTLNSRNTQTLQEKVDKL